MPDNTSRWLISNCIDLSQGTDRDDAVGTMIQVSGLAIKMQFRYASGLALYFKVFVVEANAALLGGTNTIFQNTISNGMLDKIQKQYKVLKTIVVNPPVRGHGSHETPPFFRKLWVPLKKRYDFRTSALNNSTSKNVGIIATAYHAGNPATLDVGQISCYSSVYYKDF